MDALGVDFKNTSGTTAYDSAFAAVSGISDISRLRIGDSICMVTIRTIEGAETEGYTAADKSDIEKSIDVDMYWRWGSPNSYVALTAPETPLARKNYGDAYKEALSAGDACKATEVKTSN